MNNLLKVGFEPDEEGSTKWQDCHFGRTAPEGRALWIARVYPSLSAKSKDLDRPPSDPDRPLF
jgi:hypothetical protein